MHKRQSRGPPLEEIQGLVGPILISKLDRERTTGPLSNSTRARSAQNTSLAMA